MIDWNPIVRAGAHFTGAFAIPAGGAFVSSLAMHGIEGVANFGINLYNKRHPEKEIEPFEIDPKVKNAIKLISSAVVGIAYTYGTLGTEIDQFANSGIFQTGQYLADIGGSLAGIAAFHKLDIKDTAASFMDKIWGLSKAITKPINQLEDKITGKNKNNSERTNDLKVEQINVSPEIEKAKEEVPAWDLSLYENSRGIQNTNNATDKEITPELGSNELNVEDEMDI